MLSRIQQIGKNNNKDIEEKLNQILEKIEPKIIKISNNTNCYYCNIELENGDIMNKYKCPKCNKQYNILDSCQQYMTEDEIKIKKEKINKKSKAKDKKDNSKKE